MTPSGGEAKWGPKMDVCRACGSGLKLVGTEEFRVGGTTGGWKLLFGEWAELGEDMIPLQLWVCPSCRRVEFRVPPAPA